MKHRPTEYRYTYEGDAVAAAAYLPQAKTMLRILDTGMKRSEREIGSMTRQFPDAKITVRRHFNLYAIHIDAGSLESYPVCSLKGFYIEQSGGNGNYLLADPYNIPDYRNDIQAGTHQQIASPILVVSWDWSEDWMHRGVSSDTPHIYINGCYYTTVPENFKGATVYNGYVIANTTTRWYWRPFKNTPYEFDDDALYDEIINPNGWKWVGVQWSQRDIIAGPWYYSQNGQVVGDWSNQANFEFEDGELVQTSNFERKYPQQGVSISTTTWDNDVGTNIQENLGGGGDDIRISCSITATAYYAVATLNPDYNPVLTCNSTTNRQYLSADVEEDTQQGCNGLVIHTCPSEGDPSKECFAVALEATTTEVTYGVSNLSANPLPGPKFSSSYTWVKTRTTDNGYTETQTGYERVDSISMEGNTEKLLRFTFRKYIYTQATTGNFYHGGSVTGAINTYTQVPTGSAQTRMEAIAASIESDGCGAASIPPSPTTIDTCNKGANYVRSLNADRHVRDAYDVEYVLEVGDLEIQIVDGVYEKTYTTLWGPYGSTIGPSSTSGQCLGGGASVGGIRNWIAGLDLFYDGNAGDVFYTTYTNDYIVRMIVECSPREDVALVLEQSFLTGQTPLYRVYWKTMDAEHVIDSGQMPVDLLFTPWDPGLDSLYFPSRDLLYYFNGGAHNSGSFSVTSARIVSTEKETLLYSNLTIFGQTFENAYSVRTDNAGDTVQSASIDPGGITISKLKAT